MDTLNRSSLDIAAALSQYIMQQEWGNRNRRESDPLELRVHKELGSK